MAFKLFLRRHHWMSVSAVAIVVSVVVLSTVSVLAATLTTPRDYLSRQKANLNGGTGEVVTHQVFFSTVTSITNGKVKLTFTNDANNNTYWCRNAGSDLTVTQITDPTGATETASASTLGTLAGSCSQSTPDQIVVTFSGTMNATTKYGLQIVNGATARLGTGLAGNNVKVTLTTTTSADAVQDTGVYATSLIADDQVVITATVDPSLTVTLSGNTAALGTLDTTHVNQAGITSTVSTNATSGYVSLVKYDATLTSGSNTIGGVTTNIAVGESEYGASTSKAAQAITQWSPTACSTTTSTSNATTLTTTFQSFASGASAASSDATTLCFLASTTATQAPGTYTSTATLVTTAKF